MSKWSVLFMHEMEGGVGTPRVVVFLQVWSPL